MSRTSADYMAEMLAAAGVTRVYGVVGDSLNGFTDSLRRLKTIEWIHMRNEEGAAFAAGADAAGAEAPDVAAGSGVVTGGAGTSVAAAWSPTAGASDFVAGAGIVSNSAGLPGSSTMASTWPAGFCGIETTAVCAEAVATLPVVERSAIV